MTNLLNYMTPDFNLGVLIWNGTARNTVRGTVVGSLDSQGYVKFSYKRKMYYAHRVLFEMYHGYAPAEIDHVDGQKCNNVISNLRDCTHSQNLRNTGLSAANTSGLKGVSYCKSSGKYRATVKSSGVKVLDRRFDTPYEADCAAKAARATHHKSFARDS